MFNITVLKARDLIKYLAGMIIAITAIILISKTFSKTEIKQSVIEKEVKSKIGILSEKSMVSSLGQTMPAIKSINKEQKESQKENTKKDNNDLLEAMLYTQISSIKGIEKMQENTKKQEVKEEIKTEQEKIEKEETNTENTNKEPEQAGTKTEVITNNPIAENANVRYRNIKIKNQTDYTLTEDMLKPDIEITNKNIVLFHTHSCESYTSSPNYTYTPTGTFRTTDLNYTVVRVGTELENNLKQYNYNVVHSKDYHDYPAYNGSYTRSLATVENILKQTPSDIIIDVHRDAVGSRSDYAPTVKIGDTDEAAQIMFVIGTNNGGLWHPNWNQNLKFAIKIQEKAEEMYPGLFKPIMLTKSRYNQHTGKYANIIEVGATGNTLDQCLTSMKYLAKVMNEVLK